MSRKETALKYFEMHKEATAARVAEGIEKYRKGDCEISVVSDKPLPKDITVEVAQTSHEFRFGANIFMLDEFETEEKNQVFREKFPEVFNLATLPFYWCSLEPEKGKYRFHKGCEPSYRRPAIDLCLEYCEEKGIEPKAHCLNYDYMRPQWVRGMGIEEHKAELVRHFKELSSRYADKIKTWEVTNETFNVTFAKGFLDPNYSQFYRTKEFNEWSFKLADKYFPHNRLMINDHLDFGCMRSLHGEYFGERSPYFAEIERIQKCGANHLDAVGFQYHCFFSKEQEEELSMTRYNPEHIFDVLDTYEKLGKKLQITEMTVSALGDSQEDEEVQAELIKNLYSVFFCHPAMEAIIYWNVFDGYASGGNVNNMAAGENRYFGGLCRPDMSEKPAYKVLKNLVNNVWNTRETLRAENGKATFRGFYGDYKINVIADGKEIPATLTLSENGDNKFEIKI
ncbi:MAG: endo-1,4-beta-xylanase [Clostridia bacterium]|nr:endo-1,4-beta-xylanase [Clostridia bacterium]MEE1278861.1 endo-1,4-beta-xylanase [Acutalibacteraceae bacterium]